MYNNTLEFYWCDIPIGKENATDYPTLCIKWKKDERRVRKILHELSLYDNGDNYILVRSSSGKGFYRTDDAETMMLFKNECLNKGRSLFAPVRKINRVLGANSDQFDLENNLRLYRERAGLKQSEVCEMMKEFDPAFDASLLSKMENRICLPTYFQTVRLAEIYGCEPHDLVCNVF